MIYREYLVMRKALAWYACIVLLIATLNGASFNFGSIAMTAGVFAAFFAWIFGIALGNASRDAARIIWVLPAERWKSALQVIGVDLAGITAAFALEYTAQFISTVVAGLRGGAHLHGGIAAGAIVLSLALAYATYGWSALAGMIGRRMPNFGLLAAPALVLWFILGQIPGRIGAAMRGPILANPVATFNTAIAIQAQQTQHAALDLVSTSLQWLGTSWETPVLLAIAAITCGSTIALWQRAQALT